MPPTATASPQWVLHPNHAPESASALARALNSPLAVGHALVNRGIRREAEARDFLEPSLENLHEPAHMLDLERAAERILAGVAREERMFVQGDYDVDGITATFLLTSTLEELRARVEYHIPHRINDGYGLTERSIDEAHRRGCTLVITVDCGITAVEAIAHARSLGIDVIVTDHHEPPVQLPDAYAILNPLRPGCPYPFKSLAGVGVAFKLAEQLLRGRGGLDRARRYLDVVALGTIADVVPLVGENRVLARLGLDRLNREPRLGLRALMEVSRVGGRSGGRGPAGAGAPRKTITSGHVAFVLAPRINAAGRLGNAEQGLRLLLARDQGEADAIARSLEDDNTKRRQMDEQVLLEAESMVKDLDYPECSSILLWSERWHPGVIGIVASRLVERFQRPTVLVALKDGRGRGSGRSLPGLDLTRLLEGCDDLLLAHGGHAFAAGLSVSPEHLPELRERFERLVREQSQPDTFVQHLELDAELRAGDCDMELVEWLERMAPHGLDNPEPVFRMSHARVDQVQEVGGGKHVRLRASDDSGSVEAIGFGMGEHARALAGGRADLAFVPTRNDYLDESRVQLKLKGIRIP
jgi:single-stranded-DNA-specific exonuclease